MWRFLKQRPVRFIFCRKSYIVAPRSTDRHQQIWKNHLGALFFLPSFTKIFVKYIQHHQNPWTWYNTVLCFWEAAKFLAKFFLLCVNSGGIIHLVAWKFFILYILLHICYFPFLCEYIAVGFLNLSLPHGEVSCCILQRRSITSDSTRRWFLWQTKYNFEALEITCLYVVKCLINKAIHMHLDLGPNRHVYRNKFLLLLQSRVTYFS